MNTEPNNKTDELTPEELEQYRAAKREYMRKYRKEHPEYVLKEKKRIAARHRKKLQANQS